MTTVKVVKIIGTSDDSWEDAVHNAVDRATQTIDDVRGIEVTDWTASIEGESISEYKATVELAFPIHADEP